MTHTIPCAIMRGGTSKGLYIEGKHLPPPGPQRDHILLRLMGSPDLRQIDGLGAATSVTSKVAIIGPASRPDADVDYTFAQVGIDKPLVSYGGNCGNISSGVGPFAIEAGLVKAQDGLTEVRIYNTNTDKLIIAQVKTPGGKVRYEGDFAMAGVPGTAAPVRMAFPNPAGAVTGRLLPTGHPTDTLLVPGLGDLRISIVDAANPVTFVRAEDLGLPACAAPALINADADMLRRFESVRAQAAMLLGFISRPEDSATLSPTVPKLAFVTAPQDFTTATGEQIPAEQVDILAQMMSMQRAHETYALTAILCTGCAAVIPGTIVHELTQGRLSPDSLRIGHPGGIAQAGVEYHMDAQGEIHIGSAFSWRTARLLMRGTAYT